MSTTTDTTTTAAHALAVAARLADAPAHTITVHRYGGDGDASTHWVIYGHQPHRASRAMTWRHLGCIDDPSKNANTRKVAQ